MHDARNERFICDSYESVVKYVAKGVYLGKSTIQDNTIFIDLYNSNILNSL